jgi:hypothetical protein
MQNRHPTVDFHTGSLGANTHYLVKHQWFDNCKKSRTSRAREAVKTR